jgi:hypothetical protein
MAGTCGAVVPDPSITPGLEPVGIGPINLPSKALIGLIKPFFNAARLNIGLFKTLFKDMS